MDIRTRQAEAGTRVIELHGDLDVYTSPRLWQTMDRLLKQGHHSLVINLSGVRQIDSSGLGMLVAGLKKLRQQRGRLVLAAPNDHVDRTLRVTGLIKLFEVFDTEAEALLEMTPTPPGAPADSAAEQTALT